VPHKSRNRKEVISTQQSAISKEEAVSAQHSAISQDKSTAEGGCGHKIQKKKKLAA
jgi:hypothetical protein